MRLPANKPADRIFLENRSKTLLPVKKYRRRGQQILRLLAKVKKHRLGPNTTVNFRFVDGKEIRRWHRKYFGDRSATDVIAFPMREGKKLARTGEMLGDVVVCVDTARKQARKFGNTVEEEMTLYMIHGILHLLGYDDTHPSQKKVMDRLQFSILNRVMRRHG